MMNCYVLPEWNVQRQLWMQDLEIRTANCLTEELKDNATKFNRWTV